MMSISSSNSTSKYIVKLIIYSRGGMVSPLSYRSTVLTDVSKTYANFTLVILLIYYILVNIMTIIRS